MFGERVVTSPDGREWTVARRWLPRAPRWRGRRLGTTAIAEPGSENASEWIDGLSWGAEAAGAIDELWPLAAVLFLAAFLVLAWVFLLPTLVLVLDAVVAVLFGGTVIAFRELFRRPWTVVASDHTTSRTWKVVGWRRSGRVILAIAAQLGHGTPLAEVNGPKG